MRRPVNRIFCSGLLLVCAGCTFRELFLVYFGGFDPTHCITVIIIILSEEWPFLLHRFRSLFFFSEFHFIRQFRWSTCAVRSVACIRSIYLYFYFLQLLRRRQNSRVIAFKIPIKPIKSLPYWLYFIHIIIDFVERIRQVNENKAIARAYSEFR